MSNDNFHSLDTEEIDQEKLELDMAGVKAKTDFLTVSGNINLDTVGTNQTTFTNKLSGASASGLKTLIEANDTDITGINDKLDGNSTSGLKNLIDLNTAKISFPGFGNTANKALPGNTVIPSSSQVNQISLNENAIDAIELKTDFITVTNAVNLDDIESDVSGLKDLIEVNSSHTRVKTSTNNRIEFYEGSTELFNSDEVKNLVDNVSITQNVNLDTIQSDVTGIKNNTLSSTLKTAVDSNTSSASQNQIVISATATKVANIVGSSTAPAPTDNLIIGSGGATNRYLRIGYGNQSNRVGFANEAYFTGGGVYAVEQDNNGDLYLDGYKIEIGSQNLNLTTMNNSIATNTSNINQAGINSNNQLTTINGIKDNTLSSTLKTAVDTNSAKVGITAQQATDIANNKTELNNIIIGADVMNYSTGRIGKVSGTSGFSIQNSALNSGVLDDAFAGLKQSNTGKTIINGTTTDPISFRKNNVEEYSSNQLKNLVDNISVTQNVDLDNMESTIVSNTSASGVNSANITNILNNTISSTLKTAVDTNSAKIGFPSTLNNLLSVSDTYELEVGNGQGIPRIRLNGQNGVTNSSEIIFIDATGNNPEYFQGFTIRYNSSANILQIGSDQNNNNSPNECLRIDRSTRETQLHKACVYLNEIEAKGASNVSPANANLMLTTKLGSLPGYSSNYYPTVKTSFSNMYFAVGGNYVAYLSSSNVGQIDFTGQHRAVPANNNLITNLENNIGKIVCSTGEICSLIEDENGIFQPQNTININESIPKVELSNSYKCKKVFGVISDGTDTENKGEKHYKVGAFTSVIHSLEDDNRLTINSVGEGAILVCNTKGNIENGDLITTSTLEGIGCKQDDDIVHNYTVCKATIDCNFDLNSDNYNCYLDENNNKIAFISCIYLL